MSDTETELDEAPAKRSKFPLILGLLLALVGGAGGFYATWSRLAVFINYMHLPTSAPLVGGLVLTLMTLPTISVSLFIAGATI